MSTATTAAASPLPRKTKMQHILEEILSTETAYVKALEALRVVYIQPLHALADAAAASQRSSGGGSSSSSSSNTIAPLLTLSQIDSVFSNILYILVIHKQFLTQFTSLLPAPPSPPDASVVVGVCKTFAVLFGKAVGCYQLYAEKFEGDAGG